MGFSPVGKNCDFWLGEMKEVRVGQRRVLIVRTEDGLQAFNGECPHQGVPLCEGHLNGTTLTCGAHRWQFDINTGAGINPVTAGLTRVAIREMGDEVFIDPSLATEKVLVGPVVQADSLGRAIAAAIREENAGTQVTDRGAYLRIEAPSPCRLSRQTLERHCERNIDFPSEIELTMSSFKGRLSMNTEAIEWTAGSNKA